MRWPWSPRRRDAEREVRATIATEAVKAQALNLVADLRETLDRLDLILQSEVRDVHNGTSHREGQ